MMNTGHQLITIPFYRIAHFFYMFFVQSSLIEYQRTYIVFKLKVKLINFDIINRWSRINVFNLFSEHKRFNYKSHQFKSNITQRKVQENLFSCNIM